MDKLKKEIFEVKKDNAIFKEHLQAELLKRSDAYRFSYDVNHNIVFPTIFIVPVNTSTLTGFTY